jgi:hypothetical protein
MSYFSYNNASSSYPYEPEQDIYGWNATYPPVATTEPPLAASDEAAIISDWLLSQDNNGGYDDAA